MTAPTNNVLFGHPIYSDPSVSFTPTFSGGSWNASFPLANLQTRYLDGSNVARSSDALAASTKFDTDLKTTRTVRVIAILVSNITKSSTPTIRIQAGNDNTFAVNLYDSTVVSYWPTGLTAEQAVGTNVWYMAIVPSGTAALRYVRVLLVDTANTDGYLNVARFCVCNGWQPDANMEYGLKQSWDTSTSEQETDGASFIYNRRNGRRVFQFRLPGITDADTLAYPWQMQRILGKDGQFVFVFDPTDAATGYERNCLAVFREISAMEYAVYNRQNVPLTIREEL